MAGAESLPFVTKEDTRQCGLALNIFQSTGLYNLNSRVLKKLVEDLSKSLMIIFNKSWKFKRTGGKPM